MSVYFTVYPTYSYVFKVLTPRQKKENAAKNAPLVRIESKVAIDSDGTVGTPAWLEVFSSQKKTHTI